MTEESPGEANDAAVPAPIPDAPILNQSIVQSSTDNQILTPPRNFEDIPLEKEDDEISLTTRTVSEYTWLRNRQKRRELYEHSNVTLVLLILCLILYTFFGAALFQYIEGQWDEQRLKTYDQRCKKEMEEELRKLRHDCIGHFFDSCFNRTRQTVKAVDSCLRHSALRIPTLPLSDFWNSFVFAFSCYTTVGYGNIVTETDNGRILCIVYSLFGIPLFFAACKSFNVFLSPHFVKIYCFFSRKIKRIVGTISRKSKEEVVEAISVSETSLYGTAEFRKIFLVALVFLVFLVLVVSALFKLFTPSFLPSDKSELSWSFFHSFYFVFTSITVIGFGDVFPEKSEIVAAFMLPFLLGACLFTASFQVMQDEMRDFIAKLTHSGWASIKRRVKSGQNVVTVASDKQYTTQ